MPFIKITYKQILLRISLILCIVSILVSCQLTPSPIANATSASLTTEETLPPAPQIFQSELLNPLDLPHPYVEETCRYLRNRWNHRNAKPGTVVMVIVFKNINRGPVELPESIRLREFFDLMDQLKAQGFSAINTEQLQAFMERNIEIPARSVLLVQDGNQGEEYYDKNFRDYFQKWGWGVINAWVSEPNIDPTLLEGNVSLENEGFIDHQARGVTQDALLNDDIGKIIIARELQGSITGFADHFAKTPTAIFWPNGGFGIRPVEAARQLNFKLGFTANPRGPIMYNWVPLADVTDPQRPTLIPEGSNIDDPLMTLPTYSPREAFMAIDLVRAIGEAAAEYASTNQAAEIAYYGKVCEEDFGHIPAP